MNTAAAGGGNFNSIGSNVGFAIPVDHAVSIVSVIQTGKDTDKVHIGDRALLGVQVQDLAGQAAPVSSGALVVEVQDKTGAQDAGIKTNDVVVSLDGKPVTDSASLRSLLVKFHPGDSVNVGWVDSAGAHHDASVKLIVGPPL
jgi:S1-C subfamily serine protease